jgi:MFS family permease
LALPLLAVISLKVNAFELGLLVALQTLAFPVLGLFVGVIADRRRKRPMMIICNFGRMITLASIPVAFLLSTLTIYQLYVVAAVNGIFTVFFEISYQSYLPVLVDRGDLLEGNAKLQTSASGAQVVGPTVAGFIYEIIGGALTIAVDAIGYLASAIALLTIRKPEPATFPEHIAERNFVKEMKEGLHIVFNSDVIEKMMFATATFNFGSSIFQAILVIFLVEMLNFKPEAIGALGTIAALGFLFGTLVTPKFTAKVGLGHSIAISAFVGIIAMLQPLALYGLAYPIMGTIGFINGVMLPIYNINTVSLRQSIVPDRLQGRMNATVRTINWGTLPAGSFVGGILGTYIGIVPTILVGGAICGASVIWIIFSEVIRLKDMPRFQESSD